MLSCTQFPSKKRARDQHRQRTGSCNQIRIHLSWSRTPASSVEAAVTEVCCVARARIRPARSLSASTSRKVIICSMSRANKRSSVQSIITRNFFGNRGSFIRYTVRQSTHAIKPENFTPNTMATPFRRPIVASCPSVVKVKDLRGRSDLKPRLRCSSRQRDLRANHAAPLADEIKDSPFLHRSADVLAVALGQSPLVRETPAQFARAARFWC